MHYTSRLSVILTLASASLALPVLAHHGWAGYDAQKAFTTTGKIVKSTYGNPHSQIDIEADGKTWHFVLAPPSRMQSRGVSEDMIAVGKTATAHGYPHTSDASEARIEYLVLDGKRFELR